MIRDLARSPRAAAIAFLVLATCLVSAPCRARADSPRFLVMSDIHFNPLYDPTLADRLVAADPSQWQGIFATSGKTGLGAYGSDSVWPLVDSALTSMKAAEPHPAFIVFPGDFLTHKFRDLYNTAVSNPTTEGFQAFVAKTMAFLVARIMETFPGVPILPTLGNNDDDCGDYEIQPNGPFVTATLDLAKRMVGGATGADFDAAWLMGGNYSVPHPTLPKTRVVSVNTVYLTPNYSNACGAANSPDPATATLTWMTDTLAAAQAAGELVWIVQHVPPGIDAFSTSTYTKCPAVAPMFAPQHQAGYEAAVSRYAASIPVIFTGHTHMDDFRLLGDTGAGTFALVTPGISPVFGQNPGFRIFTLADDGGLLDQSTYALTNLTTAATAGDAVWREEYRFRAAWSVPRVDLSALQSVYERIASDEAAAAQYVTFYAVSNPAGVGLTPANDDAYVCAAGATGTAAFVQCYCKTPSTAATAH